MTGRKIKSMPSYKVDSNYRIYTKLSNFSDFESVVALRERICLEPDLRRLITDWTRHPSSNVRFQTETSTQSYGRLQI